MTTALRLLAVAVVLVGLIPGTASGTHVPDQVVVDFIKAVHSNKPELVAGHPNFNAYDPSKSGKVQARLAYHPAAEKYWKETGLR